jgi:alanine racemase
MTTPFARIDLAALTSNYLFLCEKAGTAQVAGVVKANAYGLGMETIAETLFEAGCRTFFVAHFSEAVTLRERIHYSVISVLNGIDETDFKEAAEKNITPVLNHTGAISAWQNYAKQTEVKLPAIIHLDTGMNRLGLSSDEQKKLAAHSDLLEGLDVLAWMSHFACSDEFDNDMTPRQLARLEVALKDLPKAPVSLCNSSGIFWGQDYLHDIVRPGIALYGGNPIPNLPNPMQGVLELCSPILQIRDVTQNMTVGYGATHTIKKNGRIATIGLGYADGYHRALSNKGTVMIGGHPAPLVGRISMDLITIDVTNVPERMLSIGTPVTLIGPHRPIDVVAQEAGTIAYEVLTSLGQRVERQYITGDSD